MKLRSRFLALVLAQAVLAISTLVEATAQSQVARSVGTTLSYEASEEVPRIAHDQPAPATSGPNSRFGLAASFAVTNTNDTGAGSLRKAIVDANASPGLDIIGFAIGAGGPAVIYPNSQLPTITSPVIIDGTTQTGYAGAPLITIDGNNLLAADGLWLAPGAAGSTIRGLVVSYFPGNGIDVNANSCVIEGCYIGTTSNGLFGRGNAYTAIFVQDASNCRFGGTTSAQRNVLSGNGNFGIIIRGNSTADTVQGNNIGTDVNGSFIIRNMWDGVRLNNYAPTGQGANNCLIGGTTPGAPNIIAGNDSGGVVLFGSSVVNNRIIGNFIGTNPSGSTTLGNGGDGVRFYNSGTGGTASSTTIGGVSPLEGNIIAANRGHGIRMTAGTGGGGNNNKILGNFIGIFPSHPGSFGNGRHGIAIGTPFGGTITGTLIGGPSADSANTISGNHGAGVSLTGSGVSRTRILGNSIYGNDSLGIDLGGDGVTANDPLDADTGPNGLQNYPVIDSVTASGVLSSFRLTLNAAPSQTYKVCLYVNNPVTPPRVPQGETLLETRDVTTDLYGYVTFSFISSTVPPGQLLTMTATDANGNTSEFCPLPKPISVRRPTPGTLFIAGEKDSVEWIIRSNIAAVNIFLDTNGVTLPTPIASGYPASAKKYVWDVPSNILSRKCRVTVRSSSDGSIYDTSSIFKIKGYMLTRINGNGDYEPFDATIHGWGFSPIRQLMWPSTYWSAFNYRGMDPISGAPYEQPFRNIHQSTFPDWQLWVRTFGVNACYAPQGTTGLTVRQGAFNEWDAVSGPWHGSCYGMAVGGLLAFSHTAEFQSVFGMPSFGNLFSYDTTAWETTRGIIHQLFIYQYAKAEAQNADVNGPTSTPRAVLEQLMAELGSDNSVGRLLSIEGAGSTGGAHTLVPFRITKSPGGPTKARIYVYDVNYPGDTTKFVGVDTAAQSWSYSYQGWTSGLIYLEVPNSIFLQQPIGRWQIQAPSQPHMAQREHLGAARLTTAGPTRIMAPLSSSVTIRNGPGDAVGYGDSVFSGIADARPIIPKVGGPTQPIGFSLPQGEYQVSLEGNFYGRIVASAIDNAGIMSYSRSDADSSQHDMLTFANGITAANPDSSSRTIELQTFFPNTPVGEKGYAVTNLGLAGRDTVSMSALPGDDLLFVNKGGLTTYDLTIAVSSDSTAAAFHHVRVPLPSHSSHTVVPHWAALLDSAVTIYVDIGNDGTIDDSLKVQNQVTAIDRQVAITAPIEFSLEQNYPNPFNPTTVVSFQLPVASEVRLVVYDVLGRKVTVLVNERKEAGNYSVTFDASRFASGIYIYRLTAGSFAQTRKMTLVR